MKRLLILLGAVLVAGAACGAAYLLHCQRGLASAEELARGRQWGPARQALDRYLWLAPDDGRARLLMAEALVKDETISTADAVADALAHLDRVDDDSPLGGQARLQAARLLFLIAHRPSDAEAQLRRAIAREPDLLAAHYLLWKLYDLSGRSHLAEPVFSRVYELTPEAERAARLREWYMSQFYPATANRELEEMMGLASADASSAGRREGDRLARIRRSEPEAAVNHAALARWFHLEGDPAFALRILQEAEALGARGTDDSFFLATRAGVLIDLGEYEQAAATLRQWPEPREGHEYWKWRAVLLEEVDRDYPAAIRAYDRALALWPGPVDWRTRNRKANCLSRSGEHGGARQEREAAAAVQALMEEGVHVRLRQALANLSSPDSLEQVADFYRGLGLSRETGYWEREITHLRESRSSRPTPWDLWP